MKEFYGNWMTDTVTKNGGRRIAGVGFDDA